eukprot:gene7516-8794_t
MDEAGKMEMEQGELDDDEVYSPSQSFATIDLQQQQPATVKDSSRISAADYAQWSNSSFIQPVVPEGFVIDQNTGFYFNATSGYFYDATAKVYFYYDVPSNSYNYYDTTTQSYQPFTPSKPTPPPPSKPDTLKKPPAPKKVALKITPSLGMKKMDNEIEKWNQKGKVLKEAFINDEKSFKLPNLQSSNSAETGWKEGDGIGKSGSALNAPIEVSMRPAGAGLGSTNEHDTDPETAITPGDDYLTVTKKRAIQRFRSIGGASVENNAFFQSKDK